MFGHFLGYFLIHEFFVDYIFAGQIGREIPWEVATAAAEL